MDLQRIGIKLFATDAPSVAVKEFIPVFHTWIQKQAVEGHLLIDVHNYSHIHNGPGILLVGWEGNFSIDSSGGRLGLLYYRKAPADGPLSILKSALQACSLIESDPALNGQMRFRTNELTIIANDRLAAPNNDTTLSQLTPALSAALSRILPEQKFTLERSSTNPKERFAVSVQTGQSASVATLLARIVSVPA